MAIATKQTGYYRRRLKCLAMKLRPSNLAKHLQTIRQPFFLLDTDAALVFCNRALEEWTGCEAEKLAGLQFRYRGPTSRLKHEIVAAALAPPPEVLQGLRMRIMLSIDHITSQSRRYAEYIPLTPGGILVLVDENEATNNAEPVPESAERQAATELHQALLSFRRRQAGRFRWDRMIGSSQQMQRVRRLSRLAVDTTASVLILGEPGTGKEHLASAIHYGQPGEPPGALVPIDCSVLDQELIASTIYAFRKRFQKEETMRRHTLYFTEAHELPGTLYPVVADFVTAGLTNQRIIASSTLEPERWSNHESMAAILGTIRIELPSLRQRKEDIAILAQMFLEENNDDIRWQRTGFSSEALDALVRYDWPGNLDELEQIIAEAHKTGASLLITTGDLPNRIRNTFDAASQAPANDKPINLESFLQSIERELIERALRLARGNKSKAAELLGMTRPRLYRRMEQFGLLDPETT